MSTAIDEKGPLTAADRKIALKICGAAHDVEDARTLLAMIGVWPVSRKGLDVLIKTGWET